MLADTQEHANVVALLDIIETEKQLSLLMEYADLQTLFSPTFWRVFNSKNGLGRDNRVIEPNLCRNLIRQIFEALKHRKRLR